MKLKRSVVFSLDWIPRYGVANQTIPGRLFEVIFMKSELRAIDLFQIGYYFVGIQISLLTSFSFLSSKFKRTFYLGRDKKA